MRRQCIGRSRRNKLSAAFIYINWGENPGCMAEKDYLSTMQRGPKTGKQEAAMMDTSTYTGAHRLEMDGREHLTISGVENVERFDENEIVMSTTAGILLVAGQNLHIGKLSLDGGELHVDGQIDVLQYEEQGKSGGGLFSRLFG